MTSVDGLARRTARKISSPPAPGRRTSVNGEMRTGELNLPRSIAVLPSEVSSTV